jgi:hypothetical protein
MGAFAFSLLGNIYNNFDNGISLVVFLSVIPILIVGMSGIIDEAFAQNQIIPSAPSNSNLISEIGSHNALTQSNVIPTFSGMVDVSKLQQLSQLAESAKVNPLGKPFLPKDLSAFNQGKSQELESFFQNNFVKRQPQLSLGEHQPTSPQSHQPQDPLTLLTAFDGLNFVSSGGFIPPDTQVAAGPNHIMEVVNTHAKIWTKQGTPINDFSLQAFFATNLGENPIDPKIMYDATSGRWFATAFVKDTSTVHLAISLTSDPTGEWYLYDIAYVLGLCPDQPKIGVGDDKFVISVNIFNNFCTGNFLGTDILVLKKSQLLSGSSVSVDEFIPNISRFGIYPAQSMGSSSTVYLASIDDVIEDVVTFYTITGMVPGTVLTIWELPISTSILPPDAIQAGSANLINTGDNRIQDADWYQGNLWLAFHDSCTPTGDIITRSCTRHIQIDTATPTVTQDFRLGATSFYYFYPAFSIDTFGGIGGVFGYSSSSTFPSIAVTGQAAGDPPNTVEQPIAVKVGTGPVEANRYGDYSGSGLDPSNPSVIWVASQYHASPWSTWIDSINVSDVDNDGVPNTTDNCPNNANPNQEDLDMDEVGDVCDSLNEITTSKTITTNHSLTGNLIVQNGAVLTIPNGFSISIPNSNNVQVQNGGGVLIESGGSLHVG